MKDDTCRRAGSDTWRTHEGEGHMKDTWRTHEDGCVRGAWRTHNMWDAWRTCVYNSDCQHLPGLGPHRPYVTLVNVLLDMPKTQRLVFYWRTHSNQTIDCKHNWRHLTSELQGVNPLWSINSVQKGPSNSPRAQESPTVSVNYSNW